MEYCYCSFDLQKNIYFLLVQKIQINGKKNLIFCLKMEFMIAENG